MNLTPIIAFLFMSLLIITPTAFDVGDYRRALAEDISCGKLKLTQEAKKYINQGDELLAIAVRKHGSFSPENRIDLELYSAFVAKVSFERARLEMEIEK